MEKLHKEAADVAMDCDVSYTWSSGHGLLAEILGPVKYLSETTFVYVEPTKPPHQHAGIAANTTQHQTRVLTAANNLLYQDWAVVAGFRKVTSENIRDALEDQYFDQLKQQIFRYKRIQPIQYFKHLKAHWVFLNEKQIDKLTKKFKRGWESVEHITAFAIRMDIDLL